VNGGWSIAKKLLGFERTMIAESFSNATNSRDATDWSTSRARTSVRRGPLADPLIRDRITQLKLDQSCLDLTLRRTQDSAKAGQAPGAESSILKYYGTELNKRRNELFLSVLGPQAVGWEGDGFERRELELTREWLRSRANSIEGGTSEIQLNIIAKRVLGLPD